MSYSISEISKKFNISVSTLRYYDKIGLLRVHRSDGNIRVFDDENIESLKMIECLKNTGMPLKDIKQFFDWCAIGDTTIDQRYDLFLKQKQSTLEQIATLNEALKRINYKCDFYKLAKEKHTTDLEEAKSALAKKYLSDDK